MESFIIFLLLVSCVIDQSTTEVLKNDPAFWICKGLEQGTQIPHPELCSSYFVCTNGFPELVKCEGELFYDRQFNVCNWAENSDCKLGEYPPYWNTSITYNKTTTDESIISNKTNIEPTPKSPPKPKSTSTPTTTTTATISNCKPSPPLTQNPSSSSTTGATDDKGNLINPLDKYNPLNVQCYHNGLYFLPHPAKCNKYFICSNHILYLHQCGYSTQWNYEKEQCELKQNSKCYYSDQIINKLTTTRKRKSTTRRLKPPTPLPTINLQTTISEEQEESTIKIEKLPECPLREQKFVPHPTDCTKYYICIAGMPALTACPNGMYWDEREEWCGYPEFTYCRAAIVKLPVKARKAIN